MENNTSAYWIGRFNMAPHPEGGFYKEVYRSQQLVQGRGTHSRNSCTSIYYLLEADDYSGFHRLSSDEIWYYHTGSAIALHVISPDGNYQMTELSSTDTGTLSIAVPSGHWFAAELLNKQGFTLVSCAVAPGFDFRDFEMARIEDLKCAYPDHEKIISRLCR